MTIDINKEDLEEIKSNYDDIVNFYLIILYPLMQ